MNTTIDLNDFVRGLNLELQRAIDDRDYEIRHLLGETLELLAELDAMEQVEQRWGHPSTPERHLTVVK